MIVVLVDDEWEQDILISVSLMSPSSQSLVISHLDRTVLLR